MKYVYHFIIAILIPLLAVPIFVVPMTGCNQPTQAQINTVVKNIATWAPIIVNDATTLATDVESFDPNDAVLIQKYLAIVVNDGTLLGIASNDYLNNPSPAGLAKIASLVSEIATNNSAALLAAAQIKNPQSLAIAKGILITVATAATIISNYLATVNVSVTPEAKQAIKTMAPYVNKVSLKSELNKAQQQGLIPQNVTLEQFGY